MKLASLKDAAVKAGLTAFWSGAAFFLEFHSALAAFPIAGLDRMVTDIQDTSTHQGGLIGVGLGLAGSATRMILSGGEFGAGHFVRTGIGGGVFGSIPGLSTYLTA